MKQETTIDELSKEWAATTCDEVCELLYLFVCDELEEHEARLVSAHLFRCPACRKALAETVRVAGSLGDALKRMRPRYYSSNN